MTSFVEGLLVRYKDYTGVVRFVSHQYITICIKTYDHKVRDVCMLVYPSQWNDVQIMNDYETEEK